MGVTRADVARAAGVSTAVVSYVINNGPRPVSDRARRAVEQAVDELGYRPNVMARALKGGESGSVGLLLPSQTNPYFAELAQAIEGALSRREVLVLMGTPGNATGQLDRYIDLLLERRVDGIVAVSETVSAAKKIGPTVPLVSVDQGTAGTGPHHHVATRGREGALRAVEHLVAHHHEWIGCVAGPPGLQVSEERIGGWRSLLRSVGAPLDPSLVAHGEFTPLGGERAAHSLLSPEGRRAAARLPRPTAVFVSSDVQTIGVLRACEQLGLDVPRDVALVSFDGTEWGGFMHPPLTSLRQPIEAMAEAVADILVDRAEADYLFDGNLLVRSSCGC